MSQSDWHTFLALIISLFNHEVPEYVCDNQGMLTSQS